jgi:DHA2 family multidrug resistance protein
LTAPAPDATSAAAVSAAVPLRHRQRVALSVKPNPYIGTLGVMLGAGIVTLTGRILSVGGPDLRGALGLSVDEAAWITTAFNMALMFMGPFSVYLGALLGTRRVLLYSGAVFMLASVLSPFSPNLSVLLFLQVIAGLSSGTFYPLTLSYALRSLPMTLVIYSVGVYSIDILGGLTLATPLVGWYTEHLSWRWFFWNGALLTPLMMLCIYRAIPNPPPASGTRPNVSWRGFLYASVGLSLLFGALDQGQRLDWFHSGVIVAMTVTGAFLLLAAAIRRWVSPNPFFNIPFVIKRNTLILGLVLFSFRFVLLTIAFLIPSYLGAIQNYRALETGRVMLWIILPQLVMGWISAQFMKRADGRLPLALGFTVVAVACLLDARLTSAWAGDNFWWSQLVLAAGLSFVFVGLIGNIVQQALESGALVSPLNALTFSAFFHGIRLFGGEIGTAVMQRVVSVRQQFHSNALGMHVNVGGWLTDERLGQLTAGLFSGSSGLEEAQGRALVALSGQVRQQAYTLAYADAFLVLVGACIAIIVMIALMKQTKIYFDSPPGRGPNPG